MSLSWVAKRKGNKRCAPACGRGCTEAEYREAHALGKAMLALLTDKRGWKIRVHENLGWHVSLVRGGLKLYPSVHNGKMSFWTLLSLSSTGLGGEPNLSVGKHFDHPQKAVDAQMKKARAYVKDFIKLSNEMLEAQR